MAFKLSSAEDRNAKYPDTFEIPNAGERAGMQVGEHCKLIFQSEEPGVVDERMWVKVTQRDGDNYIGTLANDPVTVAGVKHGDPVHFSPCHICSIDRSE